MVRPKEDVIDAYQRLYDRPPHLMSQLSGILEGDQELTPEILSQMVAHLRSCDYCQLAVEIIVAATLEQNTESASAETVEEFRKKLERLCEINHSIHELDEDIAAYAELLETHGKKEASKRYPAFAKHLKHCQACADEVEDTRKALREAVNVGLIPALEITVQTRE